MHPNVFEQKSNKDLKSPDFKTPRKNRVNCVTTYGWPK